MRRPRLEVAALVAAVLAVGTVVVVMAQERHETPPGTGESSGSVPDDPGAALPARVLEPLAARLPELHVAELPTNRLAPGLTPPTNRWFSGLVFGEAPQPVFPLPLVLRLRGASLGVGLPQVVTAADHITSSSGSDVEVTVDDADEVVVSSYDDASVTLQSSDPEGRPLVRTTVARGSPYVTHQAVRASTVTTSVAFRGTGQVRSADTATGTWGLRLRSAEVDGTRIRLAAGGSVVLFPVPADGELDRVAAYAAPLTGTRVSHRTGTARATTSLTWLTRGDEPTAVGSLPHHRGDDGTPDCSLGSWPTVLGRLVLCPTDTLTWSAPRYPARAELDLSDIDAAGRRELAAQVRDDVAAIPDAPADTYFGGKHLLRTAQLLSVADQVGADYAAEKARVHLAELLRRWTEVDGCTRRTAFCFGYDPAWKGVVGLATSFGSEEFNDHHFHLGHFLYAAAILARHDPSVVEDLRPVMTMLAADVAGGSDTGVTPRWRTFDVYGSHSWASGTGQFADGNNQESSSEAVTAWAGLELWARTAGDDALERQAAWMHAGEALAARRYWTGFDLDDPVHDGFEHSVVGIHWGGKRDHATWFSAEPSAVLGIQVIPMSPSTDHLTGDPGRIRTNVRGSGTSGPLGDYVLMYAGLAGRDDARSALARARELPDAAIDQGNSRTYLLAFLMALAQG